MSGKIIYLSKANVQLTGVQLSGSLPDRGRIGASPRARGVAIVHGVHGMALR